MSAVSASESQEEVADTLIPSIAAKIEPTDEDSLSSDNSQNPVFGAEPSTAEETAPQVDPQPAPEIPAAPPTSDSQSVVTDQDAGSATTLSGPSENPLDKATRAAFPLLSPVLEPAARYVEPAELRSLSDDDDDDLPTLQNLIAETHPDYNVEKDRAKTSPRSSRSLSVKSEGDLSDMKPQSHGPTKFSASAPPPRGGTPLSNRVVIDISDSSPLQPPKAQKRPISPDVKPPASQARPKRKHTPSLPPSSAGTPPPKRSRTHSVTAPHAHKHTVHWALDGSVVIQIQDTKFKLHQSHLAKHSTWFSDVFEGNKVEGGKHVERSEDGTTPTYILSLPNLSAKDFGRLLDGFDSAITYVHQDPSFHKMAGILRAATILSFPDFRDWAIRLLEDKWSPSIADLSPDRIAYGTESVLLARSCDVPSILKRAMYELVRSSGYGQPERDGGLCVSKRDFRALIKAREELTSVWMMTMSPYSLDLAVCPGMAGGGGGLEPTPVPAPVRCTTLDPLLAGKAHHKLVRESNIADDYLYDPLCGLQALIDADWAAEGYCQECVALRREVWANRREKIWENLNIWFDLDAI